MVFVGEDMKGHQSNAPRLKKKLKTENGTEKLKTANQLTNNSIKKVTHVLETNGNPPEIEYDEIIGRRRAVGGNLVFIVEGNNGRLGHLRYKN